MSECQLRSTDECARGLTSNNASMSSKPGGISGLLIDIGSDSKKLGIQGKCLLTLIPINSSYVLCRSVAAFSSSASISVW